MRIFTITICAALLFATTRAAKPSSTSSLPWSYEGLGSELWPLIRKKCAGPHQSPINIVRAKVKVDSQLGRLKLLNYEGGVQPVDDGAWTLTNFNGITVQLTGKFGPYKIALAGGGLPHSYQFLQLHFHWGNGDNPGAEHLIDSRRNAAELHIVHMRNRTAAEKRAHNPTQKTETQVLAILIEVGPHDNPAFDPILSVIKHVPKINETTKIREPIVFQHLLPNHGKNPDEDLNFYRYVGSLTIPDCNEGIVWTILQKSISLSERQLLMLQTIMNGHNNNRSLRDGGGGEHDLLVNNFRLVQPLHGRVVTANRLPGGGSSAIEQRATENHHQQKKSERLKRIHHHKLEGRRW